MLIGRVTLGLQRWLSRVLTTLGEDWNSVLTAVIWWPATACKSSNRGCDALFWPPVYVHPHRHPSTQLKSESFIKEKTAFDKFINDGCRSVTDTSLDEPRSSTTHICSNIGICDYNRSCRLESR